jgi:hypothetical protein
MRPPNNRDLSCIEGLGCNFSTTSFFPVTVSIPNNLDSYRSVQINYLVPIVPINSS